MNTNYQCISSDFHKTCEAIQTVFEYISNMVEELVITIAKIVQILIEISKSINASWGYIDPSYMTSLDMNNSSPRSPPCNSFKDKIVIWYIYLYPILIRIILYFECTVFSNYIFEILKYLFKFLGVYF